MKLKNNFSNFPLIQKNFLSGASLALALLIFLPTLAEAGVKKACPSVMGTDLILPKGFKIEVLHFEALTASYKVNNPDVPGEGEVDVTLEALANGVAKIQKNISSARRNPEDIVGGIFIPEKDIHTLTEDELAARKGCERTQ